MTFDDYINLLNADGELRTHLLENQLTDADIQQYVTEHSNVMLGYNLPLNLPLYRARYDSDNWIDKEDCSQYSYIQDAEGIRMFRYNLDGEQVLYTSTTPFIAFKEIENGNDRNVYISRMEATRMFTSANGEKFIMKITSRFAQLFVVKVLLLILPQEST